MTEFTVGLCLLSAVILVGLMLLFSAIRIVQEYERWSSSAWDAASVSADRASSS
jgi:hypothetical protein